MRSTFNKLINTEFFKYLFISYISVILNVVLNIITIKYLSVMELGRVTLGKTIFQSFDFSHIGIRYGLDRLLPSIKNQKLKSEVLRVAYYCIFFSSAILMLIWIFYNKSDHLFYLSFSMAGLFYALLMTYRVFYRADENKSNFIIISILVNLLPITFQIFGLIIWDKWGLVFSGLFGYLLSFIIVKCKYEIKFKLKLIRSLLILRDLQKKGFVLFISAVFTFFSTVGDRIIIEEFWGLKILGIYSVILFVFSVFSIFSVSYTEMIMNKIVQNKSFKFVLSHSIKIMVLTFLLIVVSINLLPFFVNLLIPKYNIYNIQMRNVLIGAIPYSCLPILNHYLHALDKRNVLLLINIICTVAYFSGLIVVLRRTISLDNLIFLKNSFYFIIVFVTMFFAFLYSKNKENSTK